MSSTSSSTLPTNDNNKQQARKRKGSYNNIIYSCDGKRIVYEDKE